MLELVILTPIYIISYCIFPPKGKNLALRQTFEIFRPILKNVNTSIIKVTNLSSDFYSLFSLTHYPSGQNTSQFYPSFSNLATTHSMNTCWLLWGPPVLTSVRCPTASLLFFLHRPESTQVLCLLVVYPHPLIFWSPCGQLVV